MTTTPAVRLPQFITDGGIETHLIFNMGVELPHFSAFPLNDSAAGREVIRSYYRDYLPVARAAGRSFLFATDSWRASPDWADRLGYDQAHLKQNNVTSAALCAELADEFAAAGVASAIAGIIGPRRDAWQFSHAPKTRRRTLSKCQGRTRHNAVLVLQRCSTKRQSPGGALGINPLRARLYLPQTASMSPSCRAS